MLSARAFAHRLLAGTLGLCLAATGSVAGAEEPEAAVQALLEAVSARDLGDLDGLVCAEQQGAVRAAFGDAGLGLDVMDESFRSMTVSIQQARVELLDRHSADARARVTGRLVIEVDPQELRALTRELVEAGSGPGDLPVSEAEVDEMLPFMLEALALEQRLDSEISLVLEDDAWVVCGGLGLQAAAGLCDLATPGELSRLSSLDYVESTGFDELCTYGGSHAQDYHAASVSLIPDTTLDEWREVFPPEADFEVAGVPAFSFGSDLFSEADGGVLQVSVWLPEAAQRDVDAITQALRISELVLPRLEDVLVAEPGSTSVSGPSLCDGISLLELNEASGRTFDRAEGDAWFCAWSSSDPATGLDTIVATVSDLALDDFRELFEATSAGEVQGRPALTTSNQAVAELPDGRTLAVSVDLSDTMSAEVPADLLALTLVEWLLSDIPAEPEPTATPRPGEGLLAGRDRVDDLCLALPYEDLARISGVPFEDPGLGTDFCEYYGGDPESGWHFALTSLEQRPITQWLEDYPQATRIEVRGQPAVLVEGALTELDASALVIVLVPGFEELTFAAGVGIDTSTGTEVDTASVAVALAEVGLERLLGAND
jgi:hypothetical protein